MDVVNEKCTGVKKIDWSDSLKGTVFVVFQSWWVAKKMYHMTKLLELTNV